MSFSKTTIRPGLLCDLKKSMYPCDLWGYKDKETYFNNETSTYYGFVLSGKVDIRSGQSTVSLMQNQFFSLAGPVSLQGTAEVVLFERYGYRGLPSYGGPIESAGRLCYIDNCRTSILVHPARSGDPCLNLLTFPAETKQTMHIHPTVRLGVVVSGSGKCILKKASPISLMVGDIFVIPEGAEHCFESDEGLSVVAFHPDTDVGATDQSHPMLNRTYIGK
ncbi:MAG: cupin domain-containing protein [Bdellovibrionaceae bacterium]|nr:cupin domain-containing protein [Pseudobdellovibrionaceae bacterium]